MSLCPLLCRAAFQNEREKKKGKKLTPFHVPSFPQGLSGKAGRRGPAEGSHLGARPGEDHTCAQHVCVPGTHVLVSAHTHTQACMYTAQITRKPTTPAHIYTGYTHYKSTSTHSHLPRTSIRHTHHTLAHISATCILTHCVHKEPCRCTTLTHTMHTHTHTP